MALSLGTKNSRSSKPMEEEEVGEWIVVTTPSVGSCGSGGSPDENGPNGHSDQASTPSPKHDPQAFGDCAGCGNSHRDESPSFEGEDVVDMGVRLGNVPTPPMPKMRFPHPGASGDCARSERNSEGDDFLSAGSHAGEGEDVVDMGLRLGEAPLPPARGRHSHSQGAHTGEAGSHLGGESQGRQLSSDAGSLFEGTDSESPFKKFSPLPSEQSVNTFAGKNDDTENSKLSTKPSATGSRTGAANGFLTSSGFDVHSEMVDGSSNNSSSSTSTSRSKVSEPSSPVDQVKPVNVSHLNADFKLLSTKRPRHGDMVDRGPRLGNPVILDKSSTPRSSQANSTSDFVSQLRSSTSLVGEREQNRRSLRSMKSDMSFGSERGLNTIGKSLKQILGHLTKSKSESNSIPAGNDPKKNVGTTELETSRAKLQGGREDANSKHDQESECLEVEIIPVAVSQVSNRPAFGSEEDETRNSMSREDYGIDEMATENVKLWLEDMDNGRYRLDLLTLAFCLVSLVLYFADLTTDLKLAVEYMQHGRRGFGLGTLAILLITGFLTILAGLLIYRIEWTRGRNKANYCNVDGDGDRSGLQQLFGEMSEEAPSESSVRDEAQTRGGGPSLGDASAPCHTERRGADDGQDKDPEESRTLLRMALSTSTTALRGKTGGRKATWVVPRRLWGVRIVSTLLGLGPAWRILEAMWHGVHTRRSKPSLEERQYHYHCFRQDSVTLQLLQLLEGFLEAAPQLVWQLYIFLISARERSASAALGAAATYSIMNTTSTSLLLPSQHNDDDDDDMDDVSVLRAFTLAISGLSLAVAPSLYQRAMRKDSDVEMNWPAVALYFVWRVFEVVPRVLCFALFASVFSGYVFLVVGIHWVLMFCWLLWQGANIVDGQSSSEDGPPSAGGGSEAELHRESMGDEDVKRGECSSPEGENSCVVAVDDQEALSADIQDGTNVRSGERNVKIEMEGPKVKKSKTLNAIFLVMLAYMMIFCHLNAKDGHTRYRALAYYLLFYLENAVMGILWYVMTPDLGTWYHVAGFVVVMASSVMHVALQVLYYRCCHPRRSQIPLCLPFNEAPRMTEKESL